MSWYTEALGSIGVNAPQVDVGKLLFGSEPSDYYSEKYGNYGPQEYQKLGGATGQNYQNVVNQMLSGQISEADQKNLQNTFKQNLAGIRQGSFGMPIGAEKSLEGNLASQNALQSLLLGQQQRQMGLQGAGNLFNENMYANQFGQGERKMMLDDQNARRIAQLKAGELSAGDTGLLGSLGQHILPAIGTTVAGPIGGIIGGFFGQQQKSSPGIATDAYRTPIG